MTCLQRRFTRQMSRATFGDTTYFQADSFAMLQWPRRTVTPWPGATSMAKDNLDDLLTLK